LSASVDGGTNQAPRTKDEGLRFTANNGPARLLRNDGREPECRASGHDCGHELLPGVAPNQAIAIQEGKGIVRMTPLATGTR
jgi:hypothetical protein